MNKRSVPYGLWPSTLTPELLGRRVRLGDVQWGASGQRLIWLEGRPGPQSSAYFPGGQGVLVQSLEGGSPQDLTSPQHSVRGHWGYGGGEFCAGETCVLYTEKEGRLYRQDYTGGGPQVLTPPGIQISAPALSPDGSLAVCIAARGDAESLALVSIQADSPLTILASGADFYMQPAWSPDGDRLAWVEWDHPGLPWEGGRLMLADYSPENSGLGNVRMAAGGEDTPVFQPAFSPDGRWLAYITENGELEDLVLLDLESGQRQVFNSEAGLSQPAWEQNLRMFAWESHSRGIEFVRLEKAYSSLWRVSLEGGEPGQLSLGDYTWLDHLSLAPDGRIAGVASAVHLPPVVVCGPPGRLEVTASGQPGLPLQELAPAEPITWQNADGKTIFGLYTPPHHPVYQGTGLPPAILFIHGGPTTQRFARFEVERSYFTSRGYAWLDVDYRGSSGYGRLYRQALYGNWGLVEVDDILSGAAALIKGGLADPHRMALYGSSAGGFTLLNAMIRQPGLFGAGLCLYPVTDLLHFPAGDFKLEKHYHAWLLGDLPEAEEAYRQRSPLNHVDRLADPLALFHGLEDPVVPVEQSQAVADALRARGTPCQLHLYAGEGHGFRKAETIENMYAAMEAFLQAHLLSKGES